MAGAFQSDAFQNDAFQVGVTVEVPGGELPNEVLGRMFRFKPPRIAFNVNVSVAQSIPAFTQSIDVRVTDDELVLMLVPGGSMAVSITHQKVSTVPPTADPDLVSSDDWNDPHEFTGTAADVGAAPNTGVDYLVGTATGSITGEIVAGTSPGGELGGTWASPTVDSVHSGSAHGAAVTTHEAAADPHTGYVREDLIDAAGDLYVGSADNTPAKLTKGSTGQFLQAGSSTLAYADVMFPVVFSKQGVVTVTTEADTPPPFRFYNRTGRTLTFHSVSGNATIGPSGSTMTVDVNVDGTTIMTGTKVVLPDNTGAASQVEQTTFSTTTVADDHYVSVNVDTNGGGAVQNLAVTVWFKG